MTNTVLAPGKAMLIGEYAVLRGAPAVVAAVSVYARATLLGPAATSAFIEAAVVETKRELGTRLPTGLPFPVVDTSAFLQQGRKLGVGSSAAATVAAVGALFVAAGLGLDSPAVREQVFAVAKRAHDSAQRMQGSGADLWAAVHGGVRVIGLGQPDSALEKRPLPALIRFVATSQSCSTSGVLVRLSEAKGAAERPIATLAAAAHLFLQAWKNDDAAALCAAVEQTQGGYAELGCALQRDLLTQELCEICEAARQAGGAAKPSGAGGGDLAVAFFPNDQAAQRFDERVKTLALGVSPVGLHVEADKQTA